MKLNKTTAIIGGLILAIGGVIYFTSNKSNNLTTTEKSQAIADSTITNIASTWTLQQWIQWRDDEIKKILAPTFDASEEKLILREDVIKKCSESYKFLEPYISDPNFLGDSARGKELTNFVSFVKAQNWMSIKDSTGKFTHALGNEITDKEYWNYISAEVTFPNLLKSQEFLNLMANPVTYKAAVDKINSLNTTLPTNRKWIVYPFRAQFIKSVDKTTYGRMLILIPNEPASNGDIVDKWVLFSIATPDLTPTPEVKSVSIIQNPSIADSNKAYLADFMREKDSASGEIKIIPTYLMEKDPSKNCYDCHKSAVLPIQPKTEFTFDAQGKMIENPNGIGVLPALVINRKIRRYGLSDFGPMKTNAYGPTLGPDDKQRVIDFIANTTKDIPIDSTSYPKIISAMNCASCHNDFAKINYLQAVRSNRDVKAFESGKGIVQTYIEKGWMPPRNTLSQNERTALWKCLMTEYFNPTNNSGILVDWLKGKN
jgi:hypothetical protein